MRIKITSMKKLLFVALFAFGATAATHAQTAETKKPEAKAKSCCASKAEQAQCAEMKAQLTSEQTKEETTEAAPATAKAKSSCCSEKSAAKPASCADKKVAEARKEDI